MSIVTSTVGDDGGGSCTAPPTTHVPTSHALPGALARAARERESRAHGDAAAGVAAGECNIYLIYRYILYESCSQFDSLPLTYYLTCHAALASDPTVASAHAAAVEAELSALLSPFYGGGAARTASLVEGEHHLERYAALMKAFTANVSPRRSSTSGRARGSASPDKMRPMAGVAAHAPDGRFGVQVLREAKDTFGVSLRHKGGDGTSWRT